MKDGEYDRITSAFDLVDALDKHMQEISQDRHLALAYSHVPEPLTEGQAFHPETPQERDEALNAARAANFGFEKVERLQGNIGYLELAGAPDHQDGLSRHRSQAGLGSSGRPGPEKGSYRGPEEEVGKRPGQKDRLEPLIQDLKKELEALPPDRRQPS